MSKRDYYDVLGAERSASDEELKKAYRRLAMQHHPDRNPDDAEAERKFKEASEAYAILSDPEKRRRYDQFGHAGLSGAGPGDAGGFAGGFADFADLGDFRDIFENLFGAGAGRARRSRGRGADLRYAHEIDLEDVLEGCSADLTLPKMMPCEPCKGFGTRTGEPPAHCERCGGDGEVMFRQGIFRMSRTCEACDGEGMDVSDPCRECRGSGRREGQKKIQVRIPAGVEDGMRLRVQGEGEAGLAGGPPGDLFVVVRIRPHELFQRDGIDLHCEAPVAFTQAALGAEVDVPTLSGKVSLRIPEGTQNGKVMRLRGKGLPEMRSSGRRGDQYVHIFVEVPTRMNARQRELLEDFARETGADVSPRVKGFLDRLRELFD